MISVAHFSGFPLRVIMSLVSCVLPSLFWGSLVLISTVSVVGAETKLLTPPPGAVVNARHPETHLVLRQSPSAPKVRIQVGDAGGLVDPVVSITGDNALYQHYRLPLKTGSNDFILIPEGKRFKIEYQPIQADVNLKLRGKTNYFFHQIEKLPEDCAPCHELQDKGMVALVGLPQSTSCASCHGNLIERSKWKHSTTVNSQCLACHQQSTNPWRIGLPTVSVRDLCFSCHTGKKGWFESKVLHGPVRLGGCTICHDPHGSAYPRQLWADGATDLCIACHSNMAQLLTKVREKKIPYVHGVISGPGCIACHNPHASNQIVMLNKSINDLCSGCHPGPAASDGHPVDGHPVSGPKEYLRPQRELSCTSCHEPHASYNRYLLIQTSMGGRICRECHRR